MTKEELKVYEEQLKPCPFCGKKATIYQDEWGFNLISCHNTDCSIEPCSHNKDIEQAVKDWNKRGKAEALKGFEGMTNGEVIQTLFPEVKVEINGFLVRCVFIEHEFTTLLEWWEAPYKAESEVKDGRN